MSIATPCNNICTLTPDGSECTGCKRTTAEIAAWSTMTDAEREAVMNRCLDSLWGTKCRDCIDYRKHELLDEEQGKRDNLGEALL